VAHRGRAGAYGIAADEEGGACDRRWHLDDLGEGKGAEGDALDRPGGEGVLEEDSVLARHVQGAARKRYVPDSRGGGALIRECARSGNGREIAAAVATGRAHLEEVLGGEIIIPGVVANHSTDRPVDAGREMGHLLEGGSALRIPQRIGARARVRRVARVRVVGVTL